MFSQRRRVVCLLVVLWLGGVGAVRAADHWLTVALLEDQRIDTYRRHAESGELTKVASAACPAEPGVMCLGPDQRTLFVAMRSSGELASFARRPGGRLEFLGTAAGGDDPCYVLVDRSGKYLFTAYYVANKVTVHAIDSAGRISARPIQTVLTGEHAHGLVMDPQQRWLYVPHTAANRIHMLHWRAGRLLPNEPAYLSAELGAEPRHIAMHPSGRFVYANNEAGDSLTQYAVDMTNGTLSRGQTVTTLPTTFDGKKNSTARCEMTPDGRFIYVANRGHDSLAGFSIDAERGGLKSLGQFPTEKTPRSFTIEPSGRFLYAAGQDSGHVARYRIAADGHLEPEKRTSVGPVPWCVFAFDTR